MDEARSENDRRVVTVVHIAMLAAVPVYGATLWLIREMAKRAAGAVSDRRLAWVLLAIGAAQYLAVTVFGRALLYSRRGNARDRVRSYFLIRFAAGEAIALFGLVAGLSGAPWGQAAALLAVAILALVHAAPTRNAYGTALALTERRESRV